MHMSKTNDIPAYNSDTTVEEILKQQDAYIVSLARKIVLRNGVHSNMINFEIDEIAQNARIKLWLALQKTQITNLKAYIQRIVCNESVNLIRQSKYILPLLEDKDDEFTQGNLLMIQEERMQDPSWEYEKKELMTEYISSLVDAVITLPSRQQEAMICSLKDEIEDLPQLSTAFRQHKIDIEAVNWPEERIDKQRLKASRSFSRKKLRSLMSTSLPL